MAEKEKTVAPALLKQSTHTGVMRGRDVRVMVQGKVDPAVQTVLEHLAEINHGNMLHIASLAQMFDQMTDIIQQFSDVANNMKTRTDQMARAMRDEVDGERATDESAVN